MSGFKTICFDIGQVLVRFNPKRALDRLAAITRGEPQAIWEAFSSTDMLARFEKGLLLTEGFHGAACALLRVEIPLAQFCEIWADIFDPEPNIPASLLCSLRKHYCLLALSNTDPIHFPFLRSRYALFDCFDDFVLSYQVGSRKPEPRIYQVAIERSGGNASATLFIDDSADYVREATTLGLVARQFRSREGLLADFSALGVWPLP